MSVTASIDVRPKNAILSGLPKDEFDRLAPKLRDFTVKRDQILYGSDTASLSIYFLDEGVASRSVSNSAGVRLELSIVGNESSIGERAMFKNGYFIIECAMLTDGRGWKMSPEDFHEEFYRCETLHDLILNRLEATITETAQTALCNNTHDLRHRLVRWLLTLADRSSLSVYAVTHEKLADLLAVSRSSVSIEAKKLRDEDLIEYTRGLLRITDAGKLEKESCECYQIIKDSIEIYSKVRRRW